MELDLNILNLRSVPIDVGGYRACKLQITATPTWGDAVVEVMRSLDGVSWFPFPTAITLVEPGITPSIDVSEIAFICVEVTAIAADATTAVIAFVGGDGNNVAVTEVTTEPGSAAVYVEEPTASEDIPFFHTQKAITVTSIFGETDTGTVDMKLEWRAEGSAFASGTEIRSTALTADSSEARVISGFADPTIPPGSYVALVTSGVTGSPTKLIGGFEYTVNED